MADIKKLSIGDSMNYTIGGKKYGANDVPRLQPSQTGNAKTSSDISRESVQKVQSQTADYNKSGSDISKSGIQSEVSNAPKLVESIKTGTIPEKQNQNVPPSPYRPQATVGNTVQKHTAQTMTFAPSLGTENIKTESTINREAIQKAQSQTADYYKTSAYETSKSGIQSEAQRTPRTVEAIKTGANSTPGQSGSTYKPQAHPGAIGTPHITSPKIEPQQIKPVSGSLGTGGIKTESTISREAIQKAQSQTADYYKTSAYETSKSGIQSEIQRTPRTVEAVKTGASPIPGQSGSTYKPKVQPGASPIPQTGTVHRTLSNPYMQTGNVKTQSTISSEAVQKVQSQTADYTRTSAYNTSQAVIRDRIDKTPVNVAGIQTGSVRPKGANIPFFNVIENTRNRPFNLASAVTQASGKTQSALSGQEDLGTQAAGTGIGAGIAGVQALRVAQKVSENAPIVARNAVGQLYKAGKGIYQVGLTGGLAVVAVSRTAAFIQAGQFHAISHASLQMLKTQAISTGLSQTALAQRIIHSVNGIQTRIKNGIQTAAYVGSQIKTVYTLAKNTSVRIVRGMAAGTITVAIAKNVVARYANKIVRKGLAGVKTGVSTGIKTAGKGIVKGITKGTSFVTFKAIPGTGRFVLHSGIPSVAGILTGTDDYALQGVGHALTAADIGVQTAIKGIKATPYAVKTAVKTGKNIYGAGKGTLAAARFIKNNGLRAAWNAGRKKAAQAAAEAGKSIITALINAVKALGSKVIVPLIIIIVVVMAFNGVIMIPVTSVSSIFSSMFSTSDTGIDYDVRNYLNTIVPGLSTDFQQDLTDQITDSWDDCDIVRFYSNTSTDTKPIFSGITSTSLTDEELLNMVQSKITSVFPANEELLNMIQQIFNAVILMDYELEPTEAEAKTLTEESFDNLFTIVTVETIERCGQDLLTGEGTVTTHECGSVHALSDCPNMLTGTHSSYKCSDCCYYYCPGHNYKCESPHCHGHTSYCDGCEFACDGYAYCDGHDVISYTLSLDGIYALEAEYFLDPIEQLSNITNRTEQQNTQLQELKDYHEIFVEMMSQVSINYGGGLTISDLSNVTFKNGTRTANQDVINLALSQVGQIGGQPYWSYYGFSNRVEWCACFVHWCMRHTSSASSSYPTTSNNAYCQTIANNFKANGQWGNRSYINVVAGDTIFFDWQGDGHTDHIGLVIGTDGTNVYTVEGNSGDAVKVKSYPIGSSVIYGYGLMNY